MKFGTLSQPQPVPYYSPPPPQPHSHDQYVAGILVGCLISLLVGGAFGYYLGVNSGSIQRTSTTPPSTLLIWLSGHVNISPNSGTAFWIFFDNQDTGTLTSAVFSDNSYQLWIQVGKTYTVKLYWYGSLSGTQSCSARPGIFTPETTTVSQDFLC